MPLLHLPLLGGLILVGVPVLLHLLMRQKPKHLLFPAFRFLQLKAKTNQRKIRLRHLLLLLLRMLLLALICFALAALRGRDQAGAVVILIDTSPSMEYVAGGKSRLDEAKARALELLDTVSADSKVAVLETGDTTQQWGSAAEARDKINRLALRPGAPPVTTTLAAAYRLFADYEAPGAAAASVQRQLYILSDRTPQSWEPGRIADLLGQKERLGEPGISAVYIDLGVDKPVDVAITGVEITPAAVPASREVVVRVTVSAVGQSCDTEVFCKLAGDKQAERKPIKLDAGQSAELEFINRRLKPGQYQVEVTLATADALPASNARFATFEVRGARKVLTITDEKPFAGAWDLALRVHGSFESDVKTTGEVQTAEQLRDYLAVTMLSVAEPSAELWQALTNYVHQGGHLLVVPGRDLTRDKDYTIETAQNLLPGRLRSAITTPEKEPARWQPLDRRHPLLSKFATWREQEDVGFLKYERRARRYWHVEPAAPENVVVGYAMKERHPALLERIAQRKPGSGRVVMLTTPLDLREGEAWNDYLSTTVNDGFFVVLANELLGYMAGDLEETIFNFASGQVVSLTLPPSARLPEYTLDAPSITGADTRVVRGENDVELAIRQTNLAGNVRLSGGNPSRPVAAFSLNPPGAEFNLDRLPAEEVEKLLGPGTVVAPSQQRPLAEALGDRIRRPLDFFPWLMLAFVGLLVVESIIANRFYKPEPPN